MADAMRDYFNDKVPVDAPHSFPGTTHPSRRTWGQAWNGLSKQLFVTTPQTLERARVLRNRFQRAVR